MAGKGFFHNSLDNAPGTFPGSNVVRGEKNKQYATVKSGTSGGARIVKPRKVGAPRSRQVEWSKNFKRQKEGKPMIRVYDVPKVG